MGDELLGGRSDLYLGRYAQFGGVQLQETVQATEKHDGEDGGKITYQAAELEGMQGEDG